VGRILGSAALEATYIVPSGTGAAGRIKVVARQGLDVEIVDEADLLHNVLQDVERGQAAHATTAFDSRVSISSYKTRL